MGTFLKSLGLGLQLGEVSQTTGTIIKGASVYKTTADVNQHIRKRDKFCVDKQHMNHIEVFDSSEKARAVLNLDGSLNTAKTMGSHH